MTTQAQQIHPHVAGLAPHLRAWLDLRSQEMTDLLVRLVRTESPSDDPAGLAAMADQLVELFGAHGTVTEHPVGPGGSRHLVIDVPGADPGLEHVAAIGHYDTVWPRGTIERMPCVVGGDGTLTGPGCFDMKGGIVLLHYALTALAALHALPARPLRILITCDEEVQSRTSRPLIREVADGAAGCLVLESPLPGGALKVARKGTATYRVSVTGKAAHAGIEPDRGASAVLELANQVPLIHALNDRERGTSVNVGVMQGGTRPNVVAASAEAQVDVRVTTESEAQRVAETMAALSPTIRGTQVSTVAQLTRPPMQPTPESLDLFSRASAVAASMGQVLASGSTGGASDANLVAALGVPTLDGLGPEGGGAHADSEHVCTTTMPLRAALVAGLLTIM